MHDCIGEENNASNGFFSEQDGMAFTNDCQTPGALVLQFGEENNPKVFRCSSFVVERTDKGKIQFVLCVVSCGGAVLEDFVTKHLNQVPQLLSVYQGKVDA